MSANITFAARIPAPLLVQLLGWWRGIERQRRFAGAVSIFVICGVVYICSFLGTYIQEAFGNKAAANTALYMDSVVEPVVQGLASNPSLPAETRDALERLLSPASIGKPVVAFRIWAGDRIVFSNRSELIGRSFPPSPARTSASQGEVVATFGPDSEDDEYERSLGVPIIEVHAPIRRAGTHQIIAIAETAELASELTSQIRAAQYTGYAIITTLAAALLLALFGFSGGLNSTKERAVEAEDLASRLCAASAHVLESNDRDRRNLCGELHSGPLQHAAFALLRVGALRDTADRSDQDIEVISQALETCVAQLRTLSCRLPPELSEMPLAGVLEMAVCQHVLATGMRTSQDFVELPQNLPYAMKACLFQFLEEGLSDASKYTRGSEIRVFAKGNREQLKIQLCYETDPCTPERVIHDLMSRRQNLQHRVEALGGALSFKVLSRARLSVTANFMLPNNAGGVV
jgi:signal transduction histidine kinase